MKFSHGASTGLLTLLGLSNAAAALTAQTHEKCATAFGAKSVNNVPTSTNKQSFTTFMTVVHHVHPKTTSTPPVATATSTAIILSTTTFTLSQGTDTFSSTTTLFTTETKNSMVSTATEFDTITTTSTNSATKTIQPSAGFSPINGVDTGTTYGKRSRIEGPIKRSTHGRSRNPTKQLLKSPQRVKAEQFPTSVVCNVRITATVPVSTTSTLSSTQTITARGLTNTFVTSQTYTSTSSVLPDDASTTILFSTTATFFATASAVTTTTQTSTQTAVVQARSTFYAACVPANMRTVAGDELFVTDNSDSQMIASAASAYDCCVACLQAGGDTCGVSAFYADGNFCQMIANGQCATNNDNFAAYSDVEDSGSQAVIGNSNCGVWDQLQTE